MRIKPTNQRSEEPQAKKSRYGNDRVSFLLAVPYHYKVIFQAAKSFFLKTIYNQDALQQPTTMFFSVSDNATQWTLDFSPDSVTVIVGVIVQDLTISSLELPIAAFNSLINQRQ